MLKCSALGLKAEPLPRFPNRQLFLPLNSFPPLGGNLGSDVGVDLCDGGIQIASAIVHSSLKVGWVGGFLKFYIT